MNDRHDADRRRLCFVATVPYAINVYLRAHLERLRAEYDVTIVTSGSADDLNCVIGDGVSFTPLRIERAIAPWADLVALVGLWRIFRRERFDCVHSLLPKSGLLSMVAARWADVPLRFHTFTGQVWATRSGFGKSLLKWLDRFLVSNATTVLADSRSQRSFLIANMVAAPDEIVVLADGSVAGVNVSRFTRRDDVRRTIRASNGIPANAVVFVFLGRLSRDKGVTDLMSAFATTAAGISNVHLLIVGPDEHGLERECAELARRFTGRVHRVGFTPAPENYLMASDVICLPSYREGFGSVIIEAAAAGLPAIASRIYGITDAVEDGVTGILHTPTSVPEIAEAMVRLATDEKCRLRMADAARERAVRIWPEERVTRAWSAFYEEKFAALESNPRVTTSAP